MEFYEHTCRRHAKSERKEQKKGAGLDSAGIGGAAHGKLEKDQDQRYCGEINAASGEPFFDALPSLHNQSAPICKIICNVIIYFIIFSVSFGRIRNFFTISIRIVYK